MVSTIVPNRATKPSATLALHEARTVSSAVSNRATAKHSTALMYGVATTVSTAVPNRATRDICIRRCGKSLLKKEKE